MAVVPSSSTTQSSLVATGDIDVQISTARRYPRDVQARVKQILAIATLSEQSAAECYYAIPRDGKTIEGPSVRLAEVVLSSWGNIRVGSRIARIDEDSVVAEGVCWDLESNAVMQTETSRSIKSRNGRRFGDSMIQTTSAAAMSIAWRNALFKVVPSAVWREVYEQCRKIAAGDATSRRSIVDAMLAHFLKLGATQEMVLAAVGVGAPAELEAEHITKLRGFATAIKDGQATVEDVFEAAVNELAGNAAEKPVRFGFGDRDE